jgi:SAM-dependent methyltransferase
LGATPLADALVPAERAGETDETFPLEVAFCPECSLVQILEEVPAERLFVDNYLYFSSFSPHLLEHARRHALGLIEQRELDGSSLVVELASNDGYLLRNFVEKGVPVIGIDPAPDQAAAANEAGVPTLAEFFGTALAERLVEQGHRADVIIANNVMAHVPELNDFVAGMATLLAEDGLITVENPYVRDLIEHCEFDTIYHEHFCYYSCTSVNHLVRRHGLFLNDVEYFPDLHGGTLRWHIQHFEQPTDRLKQQLEEESSAGISSPEYYRDFGARVVGVRTDLLALVRSLQANGASVAAYGAAAKGATLLNYVGLGTDMIEFVVDRNTHKQGLLMPGTHQPIYDPTQLLEAQPDYTLLLAWNFEREILEQQEEYLRRGGRFIRPVPTPQVVA